MIKLVCLFALMLSLPDLVPLEVTVQDKFLKLKRASFMLGTWTIKTQKGVSMEVWNKRSDSSFQGKSWMILNGDTVSRESILLVQRGENLFYIPAVKNQNNGQALPFRLTAGTEDRLVFENTTHDFPQVIRYSRVSGDSILADISGIVNGVTRTQVYPMTRIK